MAQRERFSGREMHYTRGKCFVDTNILVYAYDSSAGKKWKTSSEILSSLWMHRTGALSTQVIQELFVNLTQKVRNRISPEKAKGIIIDLLRWPLVVNDRENILQAVDIHIKYQFSFWDSLILQAAIASRSEFLLSEDFQDRQIIESVTILNPFVE